MAPSKRLKILWMKLDKSLITIHYSIDKNVMRSKAKAPRKIIFKQGKGETGVITPLRYCLG